MTLRNPNIGCPASMLRMRDGGPEAEVPNLQAMLFVVLTTDVISDVTSPQLAPRASAEPTVRHCGRPLLPSFTLILVMLSAFD